MKLLNNQKLKKLLKKNKNKFKKNLKNKKTKKLFKNMPLIVKLQVMVIIKKKMIN